ncbi:UNVERIFIED_CONTAM: hypothetical protein Slati_3842800 [Sesamum latifolium]|uniref:Uncharacterized protein n=1 Tax=Sesamum latifolium TaxID=2727402 RepID=A0AAW2TLH2_9LAMI
MVAHRVFKSGCRWRVVLGTSIRVWDPWLPRPHTYRPITHQPSHAVNLRVSDLINSDLQDWNSALVKDLFWPMDSDIILKIPLSRAGVDDSIVWHPTRNGMFSVLSAYHLACSLEGKLSSRN